jgi:hypothetical protein
MDDIEPPQTPLRPRRQLADSRRVLEQVQVRLAGVHAGWPFKQRGLCDPKHDVSGLAFTLAAAVGAGLAAQR